MKRKCLDEGILQAFADGELAPELMRETETHLALCASCTEALREAESELALFSAAFAPDASLGVPTEILRTRIEAAIGELNSAHHATRKSSSWNLKGLLTALVAPFATAPQRAAAFASLIAVVAFVVFFATIQLRRTHPNGQTDSQIAAVPSNPEIKPAPVTGGSQEEAAPAVATPISESGGRIVKVKNTSTGRGRAVLPTRRAVDNLPVAVAVENEVAQKTVPGEENYQQAIASLSRAIKAGGDAALTPHVRADYERNLAVVDKAIEETRRAALRNPQDAGATGFLFSAYQSKLDLLTAVADQAQSSALGR